MSFTYVLGKMISLAVMMLLGFAANKGGILDEKSNKSLSELVINITTPCMMLASLGATESTRSDLFMMLVLGIVFYAVFIGAAELIPKHLPIDRDDIPVYKYYTVFTNNAFMGFPVVTALWGNKALIYAALLNIPISILMYTYGIMQYAKKSEQGESLNLKKLLNIPNGSAVLVLILALCSFRFTGYVQETLDVVGSATVPLSMIVVGSTLAQRPLKGIFNEKFPFVFAAVRLMIVPAVVFGLLWLLPVSPMIKGVLVVISAMPGSANGVLFAQQFSYKRTLSSRYVFISTVMSVITIPLISVIVLSRLGI